MRYFRITEIFIAMVLAAVTNSANASTAIVIFGDYQETLNRYTYLKLPHGDRISTEELMMLFASSGQYGSIGASVYDIENKRAYFVEAAQLDLLRGDPTVLIRLFDSSTQSFVNDNEIKNADPGCSMPCELTYVTYPNGYDLSYTMVHAPFKSTQQDNTGGSNNGDSAQLKPGNSNCFIATAAFGTPYMQEVIQLRNFRDKYLLTNETGRYLVSVYYRWSPPVADIIRNNKTLKFAIRKSLRPLVKLTSYF